MGRLPSTLLLSLLAVSSYLRPATAAVEVEHDAQAPILAVVPPSVVPGDGPGPVLPHKPTTLDFRLRHIFHHGTWRYPTLHRRLDVPDDAQVWMAAGDDVADKEIAPPLRARSDAIKMQRLADRRRETINSMLDVGRMTGQAVSLGSSAWTVDELSGPNITDKETVLSFARMAANAYILEPGTGEWKGVGGGFNYTEDFGWESDGLRGHIFADTKNQTVVIGLKGTSAAVFDGSETTTNDKINDNLFFGCCCGQGGQYLWKQVCDCQTSAYTCNSTCLVQALRNKNRYYYAVQDLYHNVTDLYPTADIWVTGHSLGGATVSLLGLTYGLPTVTFEAPGEAMAAARLALPTPPGYDLGMHQQRDMTGGFHFGHTADPIFMGICNTASSFCTIAGYAMQSQCHTGKTCTYDTVEDKGWRVGIGTHRINQVIKDVIQDYDEPAACKPMYNCTDCYPWEFYESNGTDTTTSSRSSTSTTTRTRTQTCKTPGWWGCLDESSTTTTTTTSTTSTSTSTSTCKTPGWFGCKDETTTTTTSTSSSSASSHTAQPAPAPTVTTTSSRPTATSSPPSSSSTTCHHPGWFGGCNDPTSTSSRPSTQPPKSSSSSSTTSCKSREWFGLICVDPSPTSAASSKARLTASKTPVSKGKCRRRNWFGWCVDWAGYQLDL